MNIKYVTPFLFTFLIQPLVAATAQEEGKLDARLRSELIGPELSIDDIAWGPLKCVLYQNYICLQCDLSQKNLDYLCSIRNVSGSDLSESEFTGIDARDAAFDKANMAVANGNYGNFENGSFYGVDLYEARLSYANLKNAQFRPVEAFNAEFFDSNLTGASLKGDFEEADFTGANLTNADMSYAKMRGAKFYGSTFANTNVKGTDFRTLYDGDYAFSVYFVDVDLTGMKGIPKVDADTVWQNVTCPDGSYADTAGPQQTCAGHFMP